MRMSRTFCYIFVFLGAGLKPAVFWLEGKTAAKGLIP